MIEGVDAREELLLRGLWDCLKNAGADTSAYGVEDTEAFERWLRMRTPREAVKEAVDAVLELRRDYDSAPLVRG